MRLRHFIFEQLTLSKPVIIITLSVALTFESSGGWDENTCTCRQDNICWCGRCIGIRSRSLMTVWVFSCGVSSFSAKHFTTVHVCNDKVINNIPKKTTTKKSWTEVNDHLWACVYQRICWLVVRACRNNR